jgi:hypothetical protein
MQAVLRRPMRCHTRRFSASTALDVHVRMADSDLDSILQEYGILFRDRVSLGPEMFHAQRHLPHVAGIYVYPSSAPLHVAHRRMGARTQSRTELLPGSVLLRGETARRDWTLAIPPLLVSRTVALGARSSWPGRVREWSERTRKFALLGDIGGSEEDFTYEFEAYQAREPL